MYIHTYIQYNDCWGNNQNSFSCLSFCTLEKRTWNKNQIGFKLVSLQGEGMLKQDGEMEKKVKQKGKPEAIFTIHFEAVSELSDGHYYLHLFLSSAGFRKIT